MMEFVYFISIKFSFKKIKVSNARIFFKFFYIYFLTFFYFFNSFRLDRRVFLVFLNAKSLIILAGWFETCQQASKRRWLVFFPVFGSDRNNEIRQVLIQVSCRDIFNISFSLFNKNSCNGSTSPCVFCTALLFFCCRMKSSTESSSTNLEAILCF